MCHDKSSLRTSQQRKMKPTQNKEDKEKKGV